MKNFKSNLKQTVRAFPLLVVMLLCSSALLAVPGWSNTNMSARQSTADELSDRQPSSAWQSSYQGYQSQLFEIGTTNVPSDYSEISSESSSPHKAGPRKLGGGTDVGEQSENSPIGESWILLLFALLACGVIAYRKMNFKHNKNMKNTILNQLSSSCKKWKTLVLIGTLLTLGVGQMWGASTVTGGYIYFDPSTSGWGTPTSVEYIISHDSYSCWYAMSNISNTKLYYISSSSWGDAKYIAFTGNYGWTSCEGNSYDSRKGYGPSGSKRTAKSTYGVNSGSTYLFYASSSSNDASITTSSPAGYLSSGYSALNSTQTINTVVKTGSGSYTSANSKATISITSYKMTGNGTVTKQTASISTSAKSNTISAARTATTTLAVGDVASGYQFDGWYTAATGGTQLSSSTTYTYYPTAATTVYARFSEKMSTVTLTASPSGKGSFTIGGAAATSTTAGVTTTRSVTAVPISGYHFVSWAVSGGATLNSTTANPVTVTGEGAGTAATLTATFAADDVYTLTVAAGTGISSVTGTTNNITAGQNIAITATVATGYTWSTWTKTSGSGTLSTFTAGTKDQTVTVGTAGDITLTASATEKKSTLTTSNHYDAGNPSYAIPTKSASSIGITTTSTLTATTPSAGYTFAGWTLSSNLVVTSGNKDTDLSITVRTNGNGSAATAQANYTEDLTTTWYIAGATGTNYPFTGWGTSGIRMTKKTGHSTEEIYYCDVVVNRVATGNEYEFQTYNSANDTYYGYNNKDITKESNSTTVYSNNPNNMHFKPYLTGTYEFKLDKTGANPVLTVTWPVFNQLRFYSAQTGGTGTNTYDFNTASTPWTKTVSLTAGSTYWFKVIEDSEFFGNTGTMTRTNSSNWTMSNVTENCGITPDFDGDYTFSYNPTTNLLSVTYPTAYKLTYDIGTVKGGNGSITSSPTTSSGSYVLSGNSVTLTAPNAKTGYTWKGWYLAADGSGTRQSSAKAYAVTMNADKTLYACYTENAYNVTVSAGAGGTVSPSGTVSVKQVSGTSITATPNTDFIFKDWTISGGGITPTTSSTSPQTFKATTTGGTITANFTNQWAICGIDDWETWNGLPKKTTNVYEGTVTLTAGNHSFKVVDRKNNAWYGKNSTTITRASSSVTGLSTSGNNITITADVPGTYTFNFNTSTKALTVTYPTAYKVTYDGNGKNDGSVPSASGTYYLPGTNVTVTNNSGYLYKTGYAFNGWNTAATPSGSSTHYDVGGTISSIGADVKLYAEWVANDYTMYFYNNASWSSVYAYMWDANNDPEKAWHGRAMTFYQSNVYKIDYRHDVQAHVKFNDNSSIETGNLTIADGQTGDNWFYNPDDASVNTGGIHHGWSQYILAANYPTSTVAAVVGEKVTVVPTVVWADGINFADINITSTRASGSANINAVVSGTNIIVSGTEAGTATFNITYTYLTHAEATITKTLTVKVMNGLTIQAKVPSDDDHWVYSNIVKMHYWGGAGTDANPSFEGDVTMSWIKDGADGKYYQACVPVGTEATPKTNFIFFYDNFNDAWRKTQDIENVTANSCYTINHTAGLDNQRNAVKEGTGLCNDSWSIQITMGSGDIYTSNIVETSDEIVSFFAPSNASESKSYRQGVVTIEHNGATVATVPANTFAASGVYTAKINTTTPALTNVALYTGDYYIRTDGAAGGWDNYKTNPANLMTEFTRNTNFPNESFSYYWVANVGHGVEQNIKGTVANDYNPVLCNFTPDEFANEADGINLRFGYEPTTNEIVRGIVGGSTTNTFLNVICADGSQIYKEIDCVTLLDEARYVSNPFDSKFQDKSNWVYEIIVYAKIDDTHKTADVVLKSFYKGIHYLLGMVKDEQGHDTSTPVSFPVIKTGTTNGVYGLRVVYDFKTNRLFAAWAPADRVIDGVLDVDADVMFLRHEDGDAAQISFNTNESRIEDIKQAIFALELDNEKADHGGTGNIERHYFISLPFDCKVSNIFGIGGFMNYWGIQRYNGAKRAQIGWFQETPTFWEWLSADDVMQAGEGYLLSVDKKALENGNVWKDGIIYQTRDTVLDPVTHKPIKTADGLSDSVVWVTHTDGSMLTMYFPSTTSGFIITPATGKALTITYPDQPCSITRDDRDKKDSNWKCIGTPGYKNITIDDYNQESEDLVYNGNKAPNFLYEFHEQTTGATWAKGTYTVTDGSAFTYHSFHSYMVQFAGTIDWAQYSKGDVASPIAPKRMPTADTKTTKVEIELLSSDDDALDRTFVWLQENATTGFDQNYDLNKMIENKANQIYSLAENDIPFAANVLPLGTDTVKLVVNIANDGEFSFSVDADKHVGMAPVLYDMYQMTETDLLSADYTIDLKKGKYEDRFFLIFKAAQPIVTSFETTADGGQNVHSSEAIYDVLGRRVNTVYPGHLYIVNGEKRIAK